MHAPVIRQLIAEHARLPVDVSTLADDADLYQAGLTSLSTVNLMLALEERFDVEFPDRLLGRRTFGSIASLASAIDELTGRATGDGQQATPAPSLVPRPPSPLLGSA